MTENQLPAHHTSARDSKLGTWLLLAIAAISVPTLYAICNPKWVPSFVSQTLKISRTLSAGAPSGRNSASPVQPQAETGNQSATSNAGDTAFGGATLPAVSAQSKPAAEAKPSKSEKGLMVPPPPATPCVLPPAFQQDQLEQAQAQASSKTQTPAGGNTPQQPDAASDKTDASQTAELESADQELQAAVNSSLRTVGEWTR